MSLPVQSSLVSRHILNVRHYVDSAKLLLRKLNEGPLQYGRAQAGTRLTRTKLPTS